GGGVGDVSGMGGGGVDLPETDAKLVRDYLRHLGVEPLPHLGAAMADQHRAVSVDIHQRTSLVELYDVKGDTKLDRRQGDTLPQHRARGVEGAYHIATSAVLARCLHLRPP